MNKRKKTIIGAVSAAAVIAVVSATAGTFAFFQDADRTETTGTAGAVELAEEEISLNGVQLSITGNGYDFDRGVYPSDTTSSAELGGGWMPEGLGEKIHVPTVFYNMYHMQENGSDICGLVHYVTNGYVCDECGKTFDSSTNMEKYKESGVRLSPVYIDYFRTKDGKVGYCIDRGKVSPTTGQLDMSAKVSDAIKRALHEGYPNKSYDGLEPYQVEQATAIALYIIEGKTYDDDGTPKGYGLTKDHIEKYTYVKEAQKDNAKKILDTVDSIVSYATTEGNAGIETFALNSKSTDAVPGKDCVFVGPYVVEASDGTTVNLSVDNANVVFTDSVNGSTITSVQANTDFYVKIPNNISEDIIITATGNIPDVVPNYYFWGGNPSEQRMVVASTVPATVSAKIGQISQLMPGDVLDVNWTVENTQNKAVVTRNRVFVWWDDAENSNAIENTFIFKGNTGISEAQSDMANGTIEDASMLFDAGEIHEFVMDDGVTTHTGYAFTIWGDHLDGAGDSESAEIFEPGTTTHYGENDGEKSYDNGSYDDDDYTKDVVGFKLGFGQKANINTSGLKLHMVVITEAIQWQNTTNEELENMTEDDWSVINRTSYDF